MHLHMHLRTCILDYGPVYAFGSLQELHIIIPMYFANKFNNITRFQLYISSFKGIIKIMPPEYKQIFTPAKCDQLNKGKTINFSYNL